MATTLASWGNASAVAEEGLRCPGTARLGSHPHPLGLSLGIGLCLVAQVLLILYHYARVTWCATRRVQSEPRPYEFWDGIRSHLSNPGGILMMVFYLCAYWMTDTMPCSYYSFEGGVRPWMVFAQIACQDFCMFVLHYFEHKGPLGPDFYKKVASARRLRILPAAASSHMSSSG